MTQTFFSHQLKDRYTWYSGDGITQKVIDYVLLEPFSQQYVNNCFVDPSINIESDHRMLVADMSTPTTKMARAKRKQKQKVMQPKPDEKALLIPEMKSAYLNKVTNNLGTIENDDKNEKILNCLKKAAAETLPK